LFEQAEQMKEKIVAASLGTADGVELARGELRAHPAHVRGSLAPERTAAFEIAAMEQGGIHCTGHHAPAAREMQEESVARRAASRHARLS
jgi:hypothetical protein